MNTLYRFAEMAQHAGLTERVGWVLLHSLWIDTAVAAALAAALWVLRRSRPNVRYAAGGIAMALMVALPIAAAVVIRPVWPAVAAVTAPRSPMRAPALPVRVGPAVAPADLPILEAPATAVTTPDPVRRWLAWSVAGWLLGVAGLSLRHLLGWTSAQRLARQCDEPPEQWRRRLGELAGKLRVTAPVRLRVSRRLHVPAVIGWLRPVVLVPVAALTDLTPQQLESLILHELAHVRRHDYLVNLLQTAAETLLFYHPAVWWASQVVRREREHCCDDLAADRCGSRVLYARALAAMEALRGAVPGGRLALAASSSSGGALLARVQRIVGLPDARPDRRTPALAALLAVATGLLLTTVAPRLVAQERREASSARGAPPATRDAKPATGYWKVASSAAAAAPSDPIEPQDLKEDNSDYRISASDLLSVTMSELAGPGKETVKQTRVTESGSISLPYLGAIKAAGLTEAELEKAIPKAYRDANLVQSMPVSVTIVEARGRRFSIQGAVERPNEYTLWDTKMRLLDAIAAAGGARGDVTSVLVVRQATPAGTDAAKDAKPADRPPTRRLRIDGPKLMAGDPDANLFVRPRDVIMVFADVGAPRGAPVTPNTVRIIVGKDGGLRLEGKDASWDDIATALERLPDHPSTVVELSADSDDVTVGRLFEARDKAQELVRKYGFKQLDVAGVGTAPARGAGAGADAGADAAPFEVYIGGKVTRPGAYAVRPGAGTTVRQMLISAGAADKDATADDTAVTVIRRKPAGGEDFIRTTLKDIFAHGGSDVPVQANDQVMVGARGKGDKPADGGK